MSIKTVSSFGFISGLGTTSSFLFPAIGLGLMIFFGLDTKIATPLFIVFAIVIRVTGDWVFWTQMFPKEMDARCFRTWRSSVKDILFSQPNAIKAMLDMFMDVVTDGVLIYLALKASVPPAWIFLAFLGCQAIAAPIQGIIVDRLDRRKYRLLSMIITAVAIFTSMGLKDGSALAIYARLFGLDHFALSTQMLIILCAKSLLSGSTVIAKSLLAGCIQTEVERKFGKT